MTDVRAAADPAGVRGAGAGLLAAGGPGLGLPGRPPHVADHGRPQLRPPLRQRVPRPHGLGGQPRQPQDGGGQYKCQGQSCRYRITIRIRLRCVLCCSEYTYTIHTIRCPCVTH